MAGFKTVLLTGAKGFVGARIADRLPGAVPAPSLRDFDEDGVKRLIDAVRPDLIIHTAAVSDIAACEKDPVSSYRANVLLPVWLARANVKAVMFSSDQVYGGCEGPGPYAEDGTAPGNLYARQKLEMEARCLDINPDTVFLRATWMYDMPKYGVVNRGNFLVNMLSSRALSFSSIQMRGLTYVREVAGNIEKAALLPGGVYNYGSENDLNMLETALWLKRELNLGITLSEAPPAHDLLMDCTKLKKHGIEFTSTIDGLKQCIRDYGLKRQ